MTMLDPAKFPDKVYIALWRTHNEGGRIIISSSEKSLAQALMDAIKQYRQPYAYFKIDACKAGHIISMPKRFHPHLKRTARRDFIYKVQMPYRHLLDKYWVRTSKLIPGFSYCSCVSPDAASDYLPRECNDDCQYCGGTSVVPSKMGYEDLSDDPVMPCFDEPVMDGQACDLIFLTGGRGLEILTLDAADTDLPADERFIKFAFVGTDITTPDTVVHFLAAFDARDEALRLKAARRAYSYKIQKIDTSPMINLGISNEQLAEIDAVFAQKE